MSRVLWTCVLLVAGAVAVTLCRLTAPEASPGEPRDFFDSPVLWPAFLALVVLSGVAGWAWPRLWFLWGPLPLLPFFAAVLGSVLLRGEGRGLWVVGLVFVLFVTVVSTVTSLVVSRVAVRRAAVTRR